MNRVLGATTVVFLLIAPLAGSAGFRVGMLLLAAGALAVIVYRDRAAVAGPLPRAVLAAWALWAVIAIASVTWSIQPQYTLGEIKAEVLYGALAFGVFYLAARTCRWEWWHCALLAGSLIVFGLHLIEEALPFRISRHSVLGQSGMWSTHLVLVAPFVVAIGWPGMWGVTRGALIRAGALALLLVAAWETGNRMVWVAFAVQLAVVAALSPAMFSADAARTMRRVLLASIGVVGVAFAFAIQDRVAMLSSGTSTAIALTFDLRPQIWSLAWERFLEAPWLGHGFGREILAPAFEAIQVPAGLRHPPVQHAHNVFIGMALELGIVGAAAFVLVLAALARQYLACFRNPEAIRFGILGLAVLAGFIAKNLTDDFLHRHNALMFWSLNGILLGMVRPHERARHWQGANSLTHNPPDWKPGERVGFTCNICGASNRDMPLAWVENREAPSCHQCGSTLRVRSLVYLLSTGLYGRPMTLPEFRVDRRITGVGLSDWEGFAGVLAGKLGYENTFYHQEPRLDIAAIPESRVGRNRFMIASDVFEHIPHYDLDASFRNSRHLLTKDGFLILAVPFRKDGDTNEYFPHLHDFRIVEHEGRKRLINTTADGVVEVFDDLDFHHGEGMTLAMRMFSEADLLRRLRAAGFSSARVCGEHFAPYGILWPMDHSLPIVARA